jgi:hypothetical protein
MGYQPSKWLSYTLPSRDEIHIFREPPKEIYTRKKERVDISDVLYNIRDDDDVGNRLQEYIKVYSKGTNPSVEVNYSNLYNYSTSTEPNQLRATRNPYTVNSAFRPPEYSLSDLQPLSRLKYQYVSATTNPGVRGDFVNCGLPQAVDHNEIKSAISVIKLGQNYPYIIQPTAVYGIAFPIEVDGSYAIKDEVINPPLSTNYNSTFLNNDTTRDLQERTKYKVIKDDALQYSFNMPASYKKDLIANRDVIIKKEDNIMKDGMVSNVSNNSEYVEYQPDLSNIKEKTPIFTPAGSNIVLMGKVSDYNPEYEYKKKIPLEFMNTTMTPENKIVNHNENVAKHEGKTISVSHGTNPKMNYENPSDELRRMNVKKGVKNRDIIGSFENQGSMMSDIGFPDKKIKIKKRKL